MKKLTLHLGMHRCASTTTQNLLRANRALLAERGIGVILRADMEAMPALDMRLWHRRYKLDPRGWGAVERFVDAVDAMAEPHVVVSEENLVGTMPGVLDRQFYPHFEHLLNRLASLKARFDLQLRFVMRRQDRYLESVYAFRVARGLAEDFDSFRASFPPAAFDWTKITAALDKYGLAGQNRIAVMDDWRGPALNRHLATLLGLETEGLVLKSRGNPSLPAVHLPLLLAMNHAGAMPDQTERKVKLLPMLSALAELDLDAVATLLSAEDARKAEENLDAKVCTGFTNSSRAAFLNLYQGANRQFLEQASVKADASVWN